MIVVEALILFRFGAPTRFADERICTNGACARRYRQRAVEEEQVAVVHSCRGRLCRLGSLGRHRRPRIV